MTERIDHATDAWRHLDDVTAYENDAHSFRFNDEEERAVKALSHASLSAQQAAVHATLALVEQQRMANIIALASLAQAHYGNYSGEAGLIGQLFDNPEEEAGNMRVKSRIREVLGFD